MKRLVVHVFFGCVLALACDPSNGDEPPASSVVAKSRPVPNFVLNDIAGKQIGLADFNESRCVAVVFMGTECPIANAFVPVLVELQKAYPAEQLQVVGVNSNPGDTAEDIRKHVEEFKVAFPVLVDEQQVAMQLLSATRQAEVLLLDERRVVCYRGRIDDRFGYEHKREAPRRHDLKEAIDELLAGKPVSMPETEPAGCLITRRERPAGEGTITYAEHVAPILAANCAECHHPGTAAPFSLLTYEDASDWSEMIREVVVQRRMPPWHADPRHGEFSNARRLTADEVDTIADWVEDGAPQGDAEKTPPPPEFEAGWRIGKPDVVFKMPEEYRVPATGTVRYKYFITKTNFKEDVWIQAAEARPGNRAVVHHIIVFYREPGARGNAGEGSWITATAPGADPVIFPEGLGRKIPAGSELVWQVHYTPTGKPETDRSEVGLVFCKEPPKHNVRTYGIKNARFRIPPGDANHEVVSTVPATHDTVILSLFPHMHLRGKDFQYQAIYPDGRREVLLSVPQYDFNWQNSYRLKTPLRVPRGTTIRCVAHFDNSEANPANPDPSKTVRWGDQTWDEMMIGYINFYWE